MWGTSITVVGDIESLDCRDQPMMVLVLTMIVVTLTVVVNGMTMAPLMKRLNMTSTPDHRMYMLHLACNGLDEQTKQFMESIKTQKELKDVNWVDVEKHICKREKHGLEKIHDADKAAWLLVLNLERAFYNANFEEGTLGADAYALLEKLMASVAANARTIPTLSLGPMYDEHFYKLLNLLRKKTETASVQITPTIAYEVCSAYLAGQRHVSHLVQHLKGLVDPEDEKGRGGRRPSAKPPGKERKMSLHGLALVSFEHHDNVRAMEEWMKTLLDGTHRSEIIEFTTRNATRLVLNKQEKVRAAAHQNHAACRSPPAVRRLPTRPPPSHAPSHRR
jgi:hypothetical protein